MEQNKVFSVSPKLQEKEEDVKFYQKPLKILAGLVAGVIVLSIGIAIVVNLQANVDPEGVKSVHPDDPSLPPSVHSEPKPGVISSKHSIKASKNSIKSIKVSEVPVPAFVKGTFFEPAFLTLRPLWNRYWKIIIGVGVALTIILTLVGVGLGVYFEQERVANELRLAEEERLREEQSKSIFLSDSDSPSILFLVTGFYGVSLLFTTITIIYAAMTSRWNSVFQTTSIRGRILETILYFITFQFFFGFFGTLIYKSMVEVVELLRSAPRKSFLRFILLAAHFILHLIGLLLSIVCLPIAILMYIWREDDRSVSFEYRWYWWIVWPHYVTALTRPDESWFD